MQATLFSIISGKTSYVFVFMNTKYLYWDKFWKS